MTVELRTPAEIGGHLETLEVLLLDLPDSVPDDGQLYKFARFVPDPDKVEDFGGEDCTDSEMVQIQSLCKCRRIVSKQND